MVVIATAGTGAITVDVVVVIEGVGMLIGFELILVLIFVVFIVCIIKLLVLRLLLGLLVRFIGTFAPLGIPPTNIGVFGCEVKFKPELFDVAGGIDANVVDNGVVCPDHSFPPQDEELLMVVVEGGRFLG